jgi:hypothetical protein
MLITAGCAANAASYATAAVSVIIVYFILRGFVEIFKR